MKNNGIDSNTMKRACRDYVLAAVTNSKKLREKISFGDQVRLSEKVMSMDYKSLLSVIFHDGAPITVREARNDEGAIKRTLKYGAAGAVGRKIGLATVGGQGLKFGKTYIINKNLAKSKGLTRGGVIGALVGVAALYLFRKLTDPCVRAGKGSSVKKHQCYAAASGKVLQSVKASIKNCAKTKDPKKCRERAKKEITKWQTIHLKNKKLATGTTQG